MTWRMSVVHRTYYEYESSVVASFNEIRMTPVSNAHQMLVHHRTVINPSVALFSYRDYWGSTVEAFDLHTAHEVLEVVSDNVVETSAAITDFPVLTWEDVLRLRNSERYCEFMRHTSLSPQLPGTESIVESIRDQATPLDGVNICVQWVRDAMTYTPGATSVFTPASDAWAAGQGVCQDYSHITLSLLRSVGIPARYVSGYHYTGSGDVGEPVIGESHAWLEAWVGEWVPLDPTSGQDVGEHHVVVAYGRDYNDVSPMRGIFSGGQSRAIDVSVTMTRQSR
jgi:transglutaminase-like putative cysteine protease